MKIKHKLYLLVPKAFRKNIKYFYYGKLMHLLYNIKHKFNYGYWDFFNTIALETTTYCNLRCKFCPNSIYNRGLWKNKKLMKPSLFKKIIDELRNIKYKGAVALYSYGEPLTDKRLPWMAFYSKQKLPKAKIEINSNGFLLTIKKYKTLVDKGIDKIYITQYGKIMPPNTKKLLSYLKKRPKKENKIIYRKQNLNELSNRGGELELEKSVNYDAPICIYPSNALTIDYKGNLILCCNDYHGKHTFGNLQNDTLLNILQNSFYKKIMKDIRNKRFNLEICKKCVGLIN